jgi:hypothetical protein
LEITSAQIRDFLDAATGVEHRRQQSVITASLQGAPVDRFENCINLLVFQVIDGPLSRALEGNAKDALGQREMLWVPRSRKMKERMNGGEPNVSRGNSVFTLLFQVSQEREDSRRIQIREVESRNRLIPLSGKKAQQQNNAVTVAVDGVRTGSTKARKMVREVVADYGAE